MTDKNKQSLLLCAYIVILLGLILFMMSAKTNKTVTQAEQAVTEAKQEYAEIKKSNIRREKEVSQNAVKEGYEKYSGDDAAVDGFNRLVQRAREYNSQHR